MRTCICSTLACLCLASIANGQGNVYLEITGSWSAADYDVSSTGPTVGATGIPEENDDLVFGTAPAAGSTTFTLVVDTSGARFIPAGSLGTTHDWYGYSHVRLVGTHRFGSASWVTSDILVGLEGPGGARATLWTNADIRLADPTLLSFRMMGDWEGARADMFIGSRTAATIGSSFLLWEYYRGEAIRSETYAAVSFRSVVVDVKPGSEDNPVDCRGGRGVIPVALLTTTDFDATTVDHTTVRFGPAEAVEIHAARSPTPGSGGPHAVPRAAGGRHTEDVDGDGDLDLVFHFANEEAGINCGDTDAVLTGGTFDGRRIWGSCAIRTVPGEELATGRGEDLAIAPNPFNPATRISFSCEESQRVRVGVHDMGGRLLSLLVDDDFAAGRHSVEWRGQDQDGRPVPSGVYLFRVERGDRVEVRRALLMK